MDSPAETTPSWVFDASDDEAMVMALAEARLAADGGEIPIGAVVVDRERRVLSRSHNCRERNHDPTAHAEILALREAGRRSGGWRLDGATLYVTVEPCAMCAAACVLARLECVVWAAPDPKAGFAGSVANLLEDPRLNHRVAWRSGLRAADATQMVENFFAKLRSRG
jgi:tRNA(adenine34) deaminase